MAEWGMAVGQAWGGRKAPAVQDLLPRQGREPGGDAGYAIPIDPDIRGRGAQQGALEEEAHA